MASILSFSRLAHHLRLQSHHYGAVLVFRNTFQARLIQESRYTRGVRLKKNIKVAAAPHFSSVLAPQESGEEGRSSEARQSRDSPRLNSTWNF